MQKSRAMRPFLRLWPAALSISIASFLAFKLMSFYVIPVGLLLGVLLACHPVGVLVGRRYYEGKPERAVRHYVVVLLFTAAMFLVVPYVMEGYFDLPRRTGSAALLFGYLVASGLALVPLYGASGMVEYGILRAAEEEGRDSRHIAYGGLLAAVLAGVLLGYALLPHAGVLALFAFALAAALYSARLSKPALVALALALVSSVASITKPSFDAAVVRALVPRSEETTAWHVARGAKPLFSGWGKYAYVDIVADRGGHSVSGAYNGAMYWSAFAKIGPDPGGNQFPLDRAIVELVAPKGKLAIIGGGGGKQVQNALDARREIEVDAYELEPAVVDFFTKIDPEANDRAYVRDGVRALAEEGRGGVRKRAGEYDGIYIADAGSFFNYYRTALNFVFFLHTREAYEDYVSALSPRGFVAALVMKDLDLGVTQRIVNVLRANGLEAATLENEKFRLVIGAKPGPMQEIWPRLGAVAAGQGLAPPERAVTFLNLENPVPTDDRGGMYVYSLYPERTLKGFFAGAVALAVLLPALFVALSRRRSAPEWLAAASAPRLLQFILLGASFVLLENAIILQIAKITLNISDAVILGTAAFLVPAVTGALFGERLVARPRLSVPLLVIAATVCLVGIASGLPVPVVLACEGLLFALSGAFFPAVLRASDKRALPVAFAADSLGACLGTAAIFFVPVLFGIRALVASSFALSALAGVWILITCRPAISR